MGRLVASFVVDVGVWKRERPSPRQRLIWLSEEGEGAVRQRIAGIDVIAEVESVEGISIGNQSQQDIDDVVLEAASIRENCLDVVAAVHAGVSDGGIEAQIIAIEHG